MTTALALVPRLDRTPVVRLFDDDPPAKWVILRPIHGEQDRAPVPLVRVPSLDDLAVDVSAFMALPPGTQGEVYGTVAVLEARLRAVLLAQRTAPAVVAATEPDQLLTPDEAAERLGVDVTWLYRHSKTLPFVRRLGHRTLRFSARGLERWQATRRPLRSE